MKSERQAKPDTEEVATIPAQFSMQDLGPILGVSRIAVLKRSQRENWAFEEVPGRGRPSQTVPVCGPPLRCATGHPGALRADL
jgi:hypothetical protein